MGKTSKTPKTPKTPKTSKTSKTRKTLTAPKTRKRLRSNQTYSRQHPSPTDFAIAATEMLQSIKNRNMVERALDRFYKKQQDAEIQKRRELFRRTQLKKNFDHFLACLGVSI